MSVFRGAILRFRLGVLAFVAVVASASSALAVSCSVSDIQTVNLLLSLPGAGPPTTGLDVLEIDLDQGGNIACGPKTGTTNTVFNDRIEIGQCIATEEPYTDICFASDTTTTGMTSVMLFGPNMGAGVTPTDDTEIDLEAGTYTVEAVSNGVPIAFSFTILNVGGDPDNQRIQEQPITIIEGDIVKPVIAAVADITVATDPGQNTASVSFATTVSDNVDPPSHFTPIFTVAGSPITSAHTFPVGTTTVTVTANADTAGNFADPITFDVTVNAPSFTVTKTLVAGPNPVVAPSTLTWSITVENTGAVALTTPVITDEITQDSATIATLTPSLTGGDTSNAGTLDPSETWTYSAAYAVPQSAIDNGSDLVNAFTFDPANAAPQSDTDTVGITTTPNLNITKTALLANGDPIPASGVAVGMQITYTYTVTNTGNVTFSGVNLSDDHAGTGSLGPIENCAIETDNGAANDTVINAGQTGITLLAPLDVVTCTSSYTVIQSDIETL